MTKNRTPNVIPRRPNLLFIMTDQQRFDTLSLAGNTMLQTPNIDRIGRQGVYFELPLSHCPVCAPDRASLLTGRGIERTKVRTNYSRTWTPGGDVMAMKTYDELLADAGYYCEYQGKWHAPIHKTAPYQGFGYERKENNGYRTEHFRMFRQWVDDRIPDREPKMGEQRDDTYKRPYIADPIDKRHGKEPGAPITDAKGKRLPDVQANRHGGFHFDAEHSLTAFQGTQAIEALRRARKSGKPFAVTVSFNYPHAPMVVAPPYYRMFDPDEMPIPATIHDEMANSPYRNANHRPTCPEYAEPGKLKYMISNYYGLVKEIDDWVGRIMATLDEIGEADNTLVIFTSDHGEMLGEHGLREKNVFYEGSVRVPLVMRFPGRIRPGTIVDEPVSHLDLFATILDYLGRDVPDSDGETLRPLIDGTDERVGERFAVAEWNYSDEGNWLDGPNFCVRTRRWKFLYGREPKPGVIDCLFDLENDPHEMNNLIGLNPDRERHRDRAERMKRLLLRYLEERNHPHLEAVRAKPTLFGDR